MNLTERMINFEERLKAIENFLGNEDKPFKHSRNKKGLVKEVQDIKRYVGFNNEDE